MPQRLYYALYETGRAMTLPARAMAEATRAAFENPWNPWSQTEIGRRLAASASLFERMTRQYAKPEFGFDTTRVTGPDGAPLPHLGEVSVHERVVWQTPFCRLVHFERVGSSPLPAQPKLLIVAPMSGHYATLLRGTVEAFLPGHEVFITDWVDASLVPLAAGRFDLDDYVDHVKDMVRHLGDGVHVLGVCQPSVPVIAAVARMEAENDPLVPRSMTLMGGPVDTRRAPTAVNQLATARGVEWFRRNCITIVPFGFPGAMRRVYPGFLQLAGFMAMNIDRHASAHWDYFQHLVSGDGESADKHREFYDEYLAVMDLTEEFYLQTVETVFVEHRLPKGTMTHRGAPVDLTAIRRCGLMTVEGEKDDISGVGQTQAAHDLCTNLPDTLREHYVQMGVGHYGVFNGSRFRREIQPRIAAFIARLDADAARAAAPEAEPASRAASRPASKPASKPASARSATPGAPAPGPDAPGPGGPSPETPAPDAPTPPGPGPELPADVPSRPEIPEPTTPGPDIPSPPSGPEAPGPSTPGPDIAPPSTPGPEMPTPTMAAGPSGVAAKPPSTAKPASMAKPASTPKPVSAAKPATQPAPAPVPETRPVSTAGSASPAKASASNVKPAPTTAPALAVSRTLDDAMAALAKPASRPAVGPVADPKAAKAGRAPELPIVAAPSTATNEPGASRVRAQPKAALRAAVTKASASKAAASKIAGSKAASSKLALSKALAPKAPRPAPALIQASASKVGSARSGGRKAPALAATAPPATSAVALAAHGALKPVSGLQKAGKSSQLGALPARAKGASKGRAGPSKRGA